MPYRKRRPKNGPNRNPSAATTVPTEVNAMKDVNSLPAVLVGSEVGPWAVAIKEEILRRNMPPWGAVKGFGDFRNDRALTPEEMELIVSWTEGGVPEVEAKDLPEKLPEPPAAAETRRNGEMVASGDFQLARPFTLDGLMPREAPGQASFQVVAVLPGGGVEPLL